MYILLFILFDTFGINLLFVPIPGIITHPSPKCKITPIRFFKILSGPEKSTQKNRQ